MTTIVSNHLALAHIYATKSWGTCKARNVTFYVHISMFRVSLENKKLNVDWFILHVCKTRLKPPPKFVGWFAFRGEDFDY
jgi:hypothetical protein